MNPAPCHPGSWPMPRRPSPCWRCWERRIVRRPACPLRIERVGRNTMKFVVVTVLAGMMLAPSASAQKPELQLAAPAAEGSDKAEVDLDGALLKFALKQGLSKKDKDGKPAAGDLLSGLQ